MMLTGNCADIRMGFLELKPLGIVLDVPLYSLPHRKLPPLAASD